MVGFTPLNLVVFDVLGLISFGHDFKTSRNLDDIESNVKTPLENLKRIGKMCTKRFAPFFSHLYSFAPRFLWGALGVSASDFAPLVEIFHTMITQALEKKRDSVEEPRDLLDQLLKDGQLSDSEIQVWSKTINQKDECLSVFTAGLDSTVSLLCYCVFDLCRNPRVLEKLRESIHDVKTHMEYLDCVIKESTRLHPVAPVLVKRAAQDTTLDGFPISAGTLLCADVMGVQVDERYWGSDAAEFNPER
jgi:cytochrome P450